MATDEYALVVALYANTEEGLADLREISRPGFLGDAVAGAGILHRGWQRSVLHQGTGGTTAYGIGTGAAAGIVAGVFLAVPFVGAAAGAVVGGIIGRRVGRREVDGLVALLGDAVPVGSTALLAVVAEDRLHEVRAALTRALRTSGRVLDEGELASHVRAFVRGNPEVLEALDRQQGRGLDG